MVVVAVGLVVPVVGGVAHFSLVEGQGELQEEEEEEEIMLPEQRVLLVLPGPVALVRRAEREEVAGEQE